MEPADRRDSGRADRGAGRSTGRGAGRARQRGWGRLGLRARFAVLAAAVTVPAGLLATHVAVEQQVAALERTTAEHARGTLDLLEANVTNLVVAGDVSALHDVLVGVRRHGSVTDAYVLDEEGRVLADGTEDEDRRFAPQAVPPALAAELPTATGPVLVRHTGVVDTALPLDLGRQRVGTVVVRYDGAGVAREAAALRRRSFGVGLVAVALAVGATSLLSRRVTAALARLTGSAREAAEAQLPEVLAAVRDGRVVTDDLLPRPLHVSGGGEVAELTEALNAYREVVTGMAGDLGRLLREQDARFASAFEGSPVGMALVDPLDDRSVAVNDALCRLLGRGRDELLALPLRALLHEEDGSAYDARLDALLDGGAPATSLEVRYLRGDGGVVWTLANVAVHRDEDGVARTVFVQLVDASARKRAEADLRRLAYHDPLTGLPNRTFLLETLDRALARSRRASAPMALLLLDVDHFKVVNDSLGHDAGDVLLREVSARLRAAVREGDTVARFGGDEFVVIAEPACDEAAALALAHRVEEALRAPVPIHGRDVHVSASIGVAASRGATDARALLRDADTAAYWAKARGRARCELFDEDLRRRADARLETEQDLRQALERDEVVPHYQPVVCTATGDVLGFEALARWHHPQRGVLGPAAFLEVAVETGLIVPVGRRVLERACRDLATWDATSPQRPWVSVNIDVQQLQLEGFADDVATVLRATGTDPSRIRLELTEGAFLDLASVEATRRLRALGVGLAVDDFGTGYSSLHYLRRLPIDVLKIDRSFLDDLTADPQAAAVVRAIVELSHAIDLTVVAEGVETADQLRALEDLGCDASQGYLLARPMPASSVLDYLSTATSPAATPVATIPV